MNPTINYITIPVENLEKSAFFYRDVFGWTAVEAPQKDILFYKQVAITFVLCTKTYFSSIMNLSLLGSESPSPVLLSINLTSRESVDEVFAKAIANGCTSNKVPHVTPWNAYAGFFRCFNGICWEVSYKP